MISDYSRLCYIENSAAVLSTAVCVKWKIVIRSSGLCLRCDLPFHKPFKVFRSPINIEVFFTSVNWSDWRYQVITEMNVKIAI